MKHNTLLLASLMTAAVNFSAYSANYKESYFDEKCGTFVINHSSSCNDLHKLALLYCNVNTTHLSDTLSYSKKKDAITCYTKEFESNGTIMMSLSSLLSILSTLDPDTADKVRTIFISPSVINDHCSTAIAIGYADNKRFKESDNILQDVGERYPGVEVLGQLIDNATQQGKVSDAKKYLTRLQSKEYSLDVKHQLYVSRLESAIQKKEEELSQEGEE